MDIQKFEDFIECIDKISKRRGEEKAQDINREVEEARRLSRYGERRIALENLLENLIELSVFLYTSEIDLAESAFGTTLSMYEKQLLLLHRIHARDLTDSPVFEEA